MKKMKALVVDDEPEAVTGLKIMLHEFCPGIEICGEANSTQTAIEACERLRPDLVFLDVEMPGGSGFQLLDHLGSAGRPEIIFTTAHETYAIRALREGASDYLLKPIDIEELQQAVEKAGRRLSGAAAGFPVLEKKLRVLTHDGMAFISQREIIYIEADGRYCMLHLTGGKKQMAARNIGEFEDELSFKGFFRVHKSYLVNCEHIVNVGGKSGIELALSGDHAVEISRRKKPGFMEFLAKKRS